MNQRRNLSQHGVTNLNLSTQEERQVKSVSKAGHCDTTELDCLIVRKVYWTSNCQGYFLGVGDREKSKREKKNHILYDSQLGEVFKLI